MVAGTVAHRERIEHMIAARNTAASAFFAREAPAIARLSEQIADRFSGGGRLLAFGSGAGATDAAHVAVEFMHPVLVGKQALPALDLSRTYSQALRALVRPADIVIGFPPPEGDRSIELAVREASRSGALSLVLPGTTGDWPMTLPSGDPFIRQEIVEMVYHMLWEHVHVFLERQPVDGGAAGPASALYPFLQAAAPPTVDVLREIAVSVRSKAATVDRLRQQLASEQGGAIADAAVAIRDRLNNGATIFTLGNGGSATDASDFAFDLAAPPLRAAAMSLAEDAAVLTALGNDIGAGAMFSRQLIALCRKRDIVVAISTSGGSANVIDALIEARARGALTVALLGYDGGEIARRGLADHLIVVSADQIPRIQEVHATAYHAIVELLADNTEP